MCILQHGELQYPIFPLDGNKVKTFIQMTDDIKCTSKYAHVCYMEPRYKGWEHPSVPACGKIDLIRTGSKDALLTIFVSLTVGGHMIKSLFTIQIQPNPKKK